MSVCGWVARRREHGEHLAFVDVRDHSGLIQCVVDGASDLRGEYVRADHRDGAARARRARSTPTSPTGEVEVGDCTVEVLNVGPAAAVPGRRPGRRRRGRPAQVPLPRSPPRPHAAQPAHPGGGQRALRRADGAAGLHRGRDAAVDAVHPGGGPRVPRAVPALRPGSFYVLPQSPQLVQAAARWSAASTATSRSPAACGTRTCGPTASSSSSSSTSRPASSPQDEVWRFVSEAVLDAAEAATGVRPGPIETITWHEAIDRFGSDKPDLRFGMELVELTAVFAETEFNAFQAPCVKGIGCPGGGADCGRNRLDGARPTGPSSSAPRAWSGCRSRGRRATLDSPVAKFLSDGEQAALVAALEAAEGDLVLMVADERRIACDVLGQLRARPRPPAGGRGSASATAGSSTSRMFDGVDRAGQPKPAPPPLHDAAPRRPRPAGERPAVGARAGLRPGPQRLGARLGLHPDPRARTSSSGSSTCSGSTPRRPSRRFGFFLEPFRYGAPPHGGLRRRHRPARRDPGRRGEHPRGDRVPEDPVGRRPDDRRARSPLGDRQLAELGIRVLPPPVLSRWEGRPAGDSLQRRDDGVAHRDLFDARPPSELAGPGAAGGAAAAAYARRGRRPGPPARPRRARCAALIESDRLSSVDPLGPAGHRQDDASPGWSPAPRPRRPSCRSRRSTPG